MERETPSLNYKDAMGCYPVFTCNDWSQLRTDIDSLRPDLVSIVLVTDPFGSFQQEDLIDSFDDVKQFKEHLVTDLAQYPTELPNGSTKRNLTKALANLEITVCPEPDNYLDEWTDLYAELCVRHEITGIRSFSRTAFKSLFDVPGLTMLRASHQGTTVGLHLWFTCGNVAYGHLGTTNQLGNRFMASYALYWFAIRFFRGQVNWLDLGSAPGDQSPAGSGLLDFKKRWATGSRPVYLCSRILDQNKYNSLVQSNRPPQSTYFPAYRSGELL